MIADRGTVRTGPAAPLAAALVFVTIASAQLQLNPPDIPSRFYSDHLLILEKQIAEADRQIGAAESGDRLVLEAQRNLRMMARQLLLTGRAAGDAGAVATLYGLTVASACDDFDALTDPLPSLVAEAFEAGDAGQKRLADLRRAVDALKRFNQRAAAGAATIESADPKHVDDYLERLLAPLAVLAAVRCDARPVSTWAGGIGPDGERRQTIAAADLGALQLRVDDAPLAEATRDELRWLIEMMNRALAEPDLRPRVMDFYVRLSELLDTARAFDQAAWLDKLTRQQFQSRAHTAVLLFKNARTREAAESQFAQMTRMRGLLVLMNELARHDDIAIGELRRTFMGIYRMLGNENNAAAAEQMAGLLGRVVATALRQRSLERPDKLPLDIRRAQQVFLRQYASLERELIASLPTLVDQPEQVAQPRWRQPVERLEALALDIGNLNRVPDWVERMSRLNTHAARGLYKQLRLIADDLLDASTHAGASAALREMDRQLALFESIPYETMLDDAGSPVGRLAGQDAAQIRKQLTVLRSQWAAAWGAGADPTPPGEQLLLLRRLMTWLHDGAVVLAEPEALAALNRWAAWQAPRPAASAVTDALPDLLGEATKQAAAGDWAALEATLDRIDAQAPTARLMVRLHERLGPTVAGVPGGLPGLLSQTLYAPPAHAFGVAERMDLARLSVVLGAAEAERRSGTPATTRALLDYASEIARRLLRAIDRGVETTPAEGQPQPTGIDV